MNPTDKELESLIIEGGLYDCIIDPYDALGNGDDQSSLMPDLIRLCRKVIERHGNTTDVAKRLVKQ